MDSALPRRHFGVAGIVGLAMTIGTTAPSCASQELDAAALDQSAAIVKSCSFDEMLSMTNGIPTVSGLDAGKICETIRRSLGHRPPINVLRSAFKATSLMSIHGLGTKPDIANQLMNVVKARGITDPARIISTFETVWKIFFGTGGDVTPQDLNIMLRSAGPAAHTVSDDGLMHIAALIWEQKKKANGE